MTYTFQALWPITDNTRHFLVLCQDAWPEIPTLLRQARATPTAHGRFTVAPSAHIPGSGRITDWVLIYECPAQRSRPRAYPSATQLRGATAA